MITAVDEIATARGFPPEQVRKELYWPKARPHGPVTPPSDDAPEEPAA